MKENHLFEYELHDGTKGEISIVAESDVYARSVALERICDREMIETHEVAEYKYLRSQKPNANGSFYECEGCQ